MGHDHINYGISNQDGGLIKTGLKVVMDGCSDTEHPEVGVHLMLSRFEKYFYDKIKYRTRSMDYFVWNEFNTLIEYLTGCGVRKDLTKEDLIILKNFLSFTILAVVEIEEYYVAYFCGDGYVISQDMKDNFKFIELNDQHLIIDEQEYPLYYLYNYLPIYNLAKEGLQFKSYLFSKSDYKKVGVATDGLKYILNYEDSYYKDQFIELLKTDQELKAKRFINANHHIFKDDITIAF
jgi:hypothetical protein